MRLGIGVTAIAVIVTAFACSSEVQVTSGSGGSTSDSGSTTSGGGNSNSSSGTAGDGGGAPYCDGTTLPGECSLAYQDCAPGLHCVVEGTGASARSVCAGPVPGIGQEEGFYCGPQVDCLDGLACIADRCAKFCCRGDFESCWGGACNIGVDFGDGNVATVCTVEHGPCEIFEPGGCGPGDCHVQDNGKTVCMEPSQQQSPEGGPCNALNDCGDGQGCFVDICRYYCELGSGQPVGYGGCLSGQTCTAIGQLQPPLGMCQP